LPSRAGLALVYHRVGSPAGDSRNELVPAFDLRAFQQQVDHLRDTYRVVAPSELRKAVNGWRRGDKLPIALTFDDDLPSHAEVVAPALQRAALPAAFFVCGSCFDDGHGFWWHDLQTLVDQGFFTRKPDLSGEVDFTLLARDGAAAIHAVAGQIETLRPERRDRLAAELRANVETTSSGLDAPALRGLASRGFELGFHTRRHYLLSTLDDSALATALTEGRDGLEALAGYPLKMIAYPHGKADERIARAARTAGFELGFTSFARPLRPETDPLLIGRLDAQAVPGDDFERVVVETLARA
jgi:peptidoglycan/xylan/chitin deacetylase (PgdA/CDA1 family)